MRESVADIFAEGEHAFVDDRVVGVVAALRAADDRLLAQDTEVLGDVLLGRSDHFRQLLHARLAVAEQVEQLDPGRVGENLEAARDQLDQFIGERVLRHRLVCSGTHRAATSAAALTPTADNYSTA